MEVDPEIACGIVGNIGQLWLKEQFLDLQINIDGCEFYCNRFILCACSEFFFVLLRSQVKGQAAHHVRKVNIRGIFPGIFQLVLNAIYKGENALNTENIIEFWHAVHELQIPVLASKCESFVSSHMTQENVLGIYTSALLLESEKIVKMIHEFMAENFEYFSRCQVFMLLSSKALHEILIDRNLKVDKQDNLPESILKWVSHESRGNDAGQSCAGDILEVRDTNIVSDRMSDNSTDVNNGHKGSVEVILQKPPASSQDSCLQIVAKFHTETPAARKASLGSLLKLCRLSEASRDCLEMFADTDMIMGVKETRDIVRQALEDHSKVRESVKNKVLPTTSVAPADDLSLNTENVVVYYNGWKMRAYSLDRNKLFVLPHLSFYDVVDCYTLNNSIFIITNARSGRDMTVWKFPFSKNCFTKFNDVGYCSAIVSDFCYTFNGKGVYRKRSDAKGCEWFQVFKFKRKINCVPVDIFKDNIIFYNIEFGEGTLNCFNTTTLKSWIIMSCGIMRTYATFIHKDQLYMLTDEGDLWNMTASVDPSITNPCDADINHAHRVPCVNNAYSACLERMVVRNPTSTLVQGRLWDGSYNLRCAVIYGGKLMIFADFSSYETPVIKNKILIPGLSSIHITRQYTRSKCCSLIVPSTMLVTEV